MKIIIVGVGKLGEHLAKSLVRDNNDVTLLDLNFNTAQELINNEEVTYVSGSGLDPDALIEAGISSCDLLISVMESDEANVMCSLLAKKLGAKSTIARIRKQEYASSINIIKEDLGLSMTINPDLLSANLITRVLSIPSALNATSFLKGKTYMISLKVKDDSKLSGKSIHSISNTFNGKIIMCAVERDGSTIIPRGNFKLRVGDKIYITGTIKDINDFLKYSEMIINKVKKVIISGGSNICKYLSKSLLDMGMNVKIIDIDKNKCEELSELLPGAVIVNGDVSDQNLLYEEGIKECDAFVSLTNVDEENIIYSMFASNLNVPKIITKINHIDLDGIIDKAKIDTVITPHKIATNDIVRYVRAIENSEMSECDAIYTFDNSDFNMLEFKVRDDFKGIGCKLKDLRIKNGVLIVTILRDRNIIYPSGNDYINAFDTIVVVDALNQVKKLNDILELGNE